MNGMAGRGAVLKDGGTLTVDCTVILFEDDKPINSKFRSPLYTRD